MNKKRLAKGLTAVALVAVIAVGSTFAYLSATTGTKTNKFTSANNITGTTTETKFDKDKAEDYLPGQLINKNPSLTINAGSESAYGALSLDFYGDDAVVMGEEDNQIVTGTKMSQADFAKYATINGMDTTNWTMIAKSTASGSELYMYNNELVPTDTDPAVPVKELFQSTTVNAGLRTITETELATTDVYTFTDVDKDGKYTEGTDTDLTKVSSDVLKEETTSHNYIDGNGNTLALTTLPTFVIDVKGFAVQSEGVELADAKEELIKLANAGRADDDQFKPVPAPTV
ncbi:MAG: hypothetical protein RR614_04210 [Eubacterium sp.]